MINTHDHCVILYLNDFLKGTANYSMVTTASQRPGRTSPDPTRHRVQLQGWEYSPNTRGAEITSSRSLATSAGLLPR